MNLSLAHSVAESLNTGGAIPFSPNGDIATQPPPVGTALGGRYLLTELHASGGTSVVYRGRDLLAERAGHRPLVAVKVIHGIDDRELALRLVMQEVTVSRRVPDQGLVRIHDCGQQGRLHYVVMEWLEGETLAELLARSPGRRLPYHRVMATLAPVASTIAALHRHGLIHSDVKPGNIFLTSRGRVVLMDLATVREIGTSVGGSDGDAGWIGYSPAYASPQTRKDECPSAQDDVYSLACVLYEALAGRKPFTVSPGDDVDGPEAAPARPSGLNPVQWWVLQRSLALRPATRAKTPVHLLRMLDAAGGRRLMTGSAACLALIGALVLSVTLGNGETVKDADAESARQTDGQAVFADAE